MTTMLAADLRPWHRLAIPLGAVVDYAYPMMAGRYAGSTMVVFKGERRDWKMYPPGYEVDAHFGAVAVPDDFPDDVPMSAEAVSEWEYRKQLRTGIANGHQWAVDALAALEVT